MIIRITRITGCILVGDLVHGPGMFVQSLRPGLPATSAVTAISPIDNPRERFLREYNSKNAEPRIIKLPWTLPETIKLSFGYFKL